MDREVLEEIGARREVATANATQEIEADDVLEAVDALIAVPAPPPKAPVAAAPAPAPRAALALSNATQEVDADDVLEAVALSERQPEEDREPLEPEAIAEAGDRQAPESIAPVAMGIWHSRAHADSTVKIAREPPRAKGRKFGWVVGSAMVVAAGILVVALVRVGGGTPTDRGAAAVAIGAAVQTQTATSPIQRDERPAPPAETAPPAPPAETAPAASLQVVDIGSLPMAQAVVASAKPAPPPARSAPKAATPKGAALRGAPAPAACGKGMVKVGAKCQPAPASPTKSVKTR